MDDVIKSAASIVGTSLDCAKLVVVKELLNVDDEIATKVGDALDAIMNPFVGLTTKYLREKFMNEELCSLKAQEIILGNALKYKSKNGVYDLHEIPEISIYVSVIERLQQMLCNDNLANILTKKISSAQRTKDTFYDILDGNYFQEDEGPDPVFYFLIFQDAVEICNPLGNRSGKHKVVNFYWTLLNIPPKYRSKLSSMSLFAMVKRKILDKYSFENVLAPFFEEMRQLTQGVDFLIHDKRRKCFGRVILCLGDTEGQQQIGGFKVGVGFSYRKCRLCYAVQEDVRNNFEVASFVQRSNISYVQQCDSIINAPNENIKGQLQTTYGIIEPSCLLKLKDFDITKQLPHDVMHVILEGVLPYECQLLTKDCFH